MASWVHRCPWCDWSREATSPTILAPRCTNCGGMLEAVPATAAARAEPPLRIGPHVAPAYGRLARFVLVGLLLFSAGRFGWHAGGFALALTGIGVVGLFTAPLIVSD